MCGIVGFTTAAGHDPAAAKRTAQAMADLIRHRGPDGEGYYADAHAALGHRRLSIIDLAGGGQPMFNEDGTLVVVFNGEIYNYKALHAELTARGHGDGVEAHRTQGSQDVFDGVPLPDAQPPGGDEDVGANELVLDGVGQGA